MQHTNYGWWEFWELYDPTTEIGPNAPAYGNQKVTFDGNNKLILVNAGETSLDVQEDIYSNWKEWVTVRDNAKFPQALTAIGGDPITDTRNVGITYFLENGWRIKMWEGDFQLDIDGNLYTREPGQDPYIASDGEFKNTITSTRSNLVDVVDNSQDNVNATLSQTDINTIANTTANNINEVNVSTSSINTISGNVWNVNTNTIGSANTTGKTLKDGLTKNQFLALKD